MSNQPAILAEVGVTAPASVVAGLGFPAGRRETSPTATGWRASSVTAEGASDQSLATIEVISTELSYTQVKA